MELTSKQKATAARIIIGEIYDFTQEVTNKIQIIDIMLWVTGRYWIKYVLPNTSIENTYKITKDRWNEAVEITIKQGEK